MKQLYKPAIIEMPERCANCFACSWKTENGTCRCGSCGQERKPTTTRRKAMENTILSSVREEMAKPRVAKSARQRVVRVAVPSGHTAPSTASRVLQWPASSALDGPQVEETSNNEWKATPQNR